MHSANSEEWKNEHAIEVMLIILVHILVRLVPLCLLCKPQANILPVGAAFQMFQIQRKLGYGNTICALHVTSEIKKRADSRVPAKVTSQCK